MVVCGPETVDVVATDVGATEEAPPAAQRLLYHAISSCLSDSTVHDESHVPSGEVCKVVRYPDWQKHET